MIRKIIEWIRKVWMTMIGKQTIKQAMQVDIAISEPMIEALELWAKMYANDSPWLKDNEIFSLNLAAAIASEVARTATIEMMMTIEGSKRADYLAAQFEKVLDKLRDVIEFGSAKGGLILKPYVDGKNLNVDFVHADQFYPVEFDRNGNIISAVFVDQRKKGDSWYTRLEFHELSDTVYQVRNAAYKSNSGDMLGTKVPLSVIDDWDGLEEEALITGVDKPLFAYFRYPLANNIDAASPLGVSCFSRAVDLIKQADLQWSNLMWEFEATQAAIFVDILAFGKDTQGKPILPNKRLYRTLETGSAEGELFKEWTPDIREQNILNGLDRILKQIEFTCGLAYGTLSDPNTIEKTATEIASAKQRSYATVVDVQKAVKSALDDLLYAMDTWATLNKVPKGKYTATYDFDDSVIVDKDAQFQQDLRLVQQGIMSTVEFRIRNMGEDEKTAKTKVAEARDGQGGFFEEE
ncbi:MAG: phage portal protein [Anaerolineales bacterium]|nr:phage portal protein [Anaerolineales bacterium]